MIQSIKTKKNGIEYTKTFSDKNMCIMDEYGVIYTVAYDLSNIQKTYIETNIPK